MLASKEEEQREFLSLIEIFGSISHKLLKAVGLGLNFQVNQLQGCVLQDYLTLMESLKKKKKKYS